MNGFKADFKPGKRREEPSVFTRCLGNGEESPLAGRKPSWGLNSSRSAEEAELPSACSSSASFASTVALIEKKHKLYLGRGGRMDPGARRELNILMGSKLEAADIKQNDEKKPKPIPLELEQPKEEKGPVKLTLRAILPQLLASLAVSLASMVVGFSSAYTSPALVSMNEPNSTLTVTPQQESWIGSLLPLLALLGGILGGPMIETIGRRNTIIFTGLPFIASFACIALATSVSMVMVGRAIAGFCVGVASLALPIYLGETLQPEVRGSLGLLPTLLGNGGILVCFTAGKFFDWSQLAMLGAGLPILFLSLMFLIPETPRWYINKNKVKKAKKSLIWLRGKRADVTGELVDLQNTMEHDIEETSSIKEIFSRQYIWPLVISIGLMFFQQLSGINAVIFYTVKIFQDAGSTIDSNLSAIIVGLVNVASTFAATTLIDRLGRKILLNISSISMIITLVTLGTFFYFKDIGTDLSCYGWIPLASFVIFVIGFSIGFGPIPWLMMGEILPARVRGCAASIVTAFNWTCTFVVTKTFSDLQELLGSHGVFWLFGGFCLVGLIFVNALVPETRGKSLEEIEKSLTTRCAKTIDRDLSREGSEADFKSVALP